jgi:hypothetical protein
MSNNGDNKIIVVRNIGNTLVMVINEKIVVANMLGIQKWVVPKEVLKENQCMYEKKLIKKLGKPKILLNLTPMPMLKKTCIGISNNVLCRFVAKKNLKQCGY